VAVAAEGPPELRAFYFISICLQRVQSSSPGVPVCFKNKDITIRTVRASALALDSEFKL